MPKFRVQGTTTVDVVTYVEADDWEEAEQIVQDRDVDICIHGSEIAGNQNEEEFVLVDGCNYGVMNIDAEEVI